MQHLITYAKDKTTGETRNIKDVESGLACNCVCGNCGGALEACKGKIRQHHLHRHPVQNHRDLRRLQEIARPRCPVSGIFVAGSPAEPPNPLKGERGIHYSLIFIH